MPYGADNQVKNNIKWLITILYYLRINNLSSENNNNNNKSLLIPMDLNINQAHNVL